MHKHTLIAILTSFALLLAPARADEPYGPPIASVHELLMALETADRGLETLAADVQYDRRLELQGDRHVRQGRLFYISENNGGARPSRSFAIGFTNLFIGERRQEDPQFWIFDGEWLVEKKATEKQFIKRRVAPPDADFDPLRIGEGPMPIPIGQKAQDILARYDVERRTPDELFERDSPMAKFVKGSHHLRLVPKPHRAEQDEFVELRLWYRWEETHNRFLPRLARTKSHAGDESYVQLINIKVNQNIDRRIFDVTPPQAAGWDIQVIDDLPDRAVVEAGDDRK
ncbi:MAG: hypothetical protein EA376_12990 [Phycisphaeraceae bacterium]|nr:MAG: hypothetical protein EA376_12990 [Phycisphaeraceae bacterium]